MVDYRKDIASREDFRHAMEDLYRRPQLRQHGSLRTILIYPHIKIEELPKITERKRRLKEFYISTPQSIDEGFYKVGVNLGVMNREEVFFLETGFEGIWILHFVSDESLARTLTYRFVKNSYPYLAPVRLRSEELLEVLDRLQGKYGRRPLMNRLVAKQFFDTQEGTSTYRRRTLVLYQNDCEATMKVLRASFPLFPDVIRINVRSEDESLYTATITRRGTVRLLGGPKVKYFLDDIAEFLAIPAVKRLENFKEREPKKHKGVYSSKPLEIVVGPNLHLGLMPLKESLLKEYHCITYHAGNPYLDIGVIETSSASEFRVIASGETVVVIPTKYESPSALLKLTRTIMETVGGQGEKDYERPTKAE